MQTALCQRQNPSAGPTPASWRRTPEAATLQQALPPVWQKHLLLSWGLILPTDIFRLDEGVGSWATLSPKRYTTLHYLAQVARAGRGDACPPLDPSTGWARWVAASKACLAAAKALPMAACHTTCSDPFLLPRSSPVRGQKVCATPGTVENSCRI
jgi:hypothetical protein